MIQLKSVSGHLCWHKSDMDAIILATDQPTA